ncbi:MAG: class I SAM-dependent methyltransferase [Xanthobacteraceae bacterium]
MSTFSAEWLELRESYDRAARNAAVLDAVAAAFLGVPSIAVVDLACGTGATLRALAGHLAPRQSWRLVDNNLSLLAEAATAGRAPALTVTAVPVDLARDLELALDGPLDLVTASALLDLVSAEWLDRLAVEAAARRLPVYAALSYDGRAMIEPARPLDSELLAGFNRHQRTDKGFGPALGPTAAARAAERFEHFGYSVVQGRADWICGPDDRAVQDAIFTGWAELAPLATGLAGAEVESWLAARRVCLAEGRSRLRVGHVDIFARPIGTR